MKICVTGGAGYIGSITVRKLIEKGYEVIIFDDLSTGHEENIPANITFIKGSLLDPIQITQALSGVDAVMHFAGKSLVGESVEKPDLYREVNVTGSTNLFECMRDLDINNLVFSSSAAVYGEPLSTPITESHQTKPTNPYGESKLQVENIIAEFEFSSISLRYFNVAGSFLDIKEEHNPETHLIPNILKATNDQPISVFGTDWPTPDHTCIRDYLHVEDLAEAHLLALSRISEFKNEVINLGSGRGYSVREVISAAQNKLGRNIPTIDKDRRAGDPAILLADISKAKNVLGWAPKRELIELFN